VTHALVDNHDALLFDLDGVVYAGPAALPGVPERLKEVRARGVTTMFVTNNASRTPQMVADHLTSLGVPAGADDVVTSAQAAAELVADLVPPGAPVLVVGGDGLRQAVEERGLKPVTSADADPQAVVQGFHPELTWNLLAEGAYAVAAGLPWIASNADRTIPTGRGIAPGNGALIEVIRIATGRTPQSVGKPEPTLFRAAMRRSGCSRPLVVGDRLDTDIAGAVASGCPSLLVLTGISTFADALAADPSQRPTYVAADLGGLMVEHAEPMVEPGDPDGPIVVRCGAWRARVGAKPAEVTLEPESDAPEADWDALRAMAVAVWTARDRELPVDTAAAAAAAVTAAGG